MTGIRLSESLKKKVLAFEYELDDFSWKSNRVQVWKQLKKLYQSDFTNSE